MEFEDDPLRTRLRIGYLFSLTFGPDLLTLPKAAMRPIVLSLLTGCAALALSGCVAQRAITAYADRLNPQGPYADGRPVDDAAPFADIGYAQWNDAEPPYRLYPGDKVSVGDATCLSVGAPPNARPGSVTEPVTAPARREAFDGVTVIVPVYADYDATRACLDRLVAELDELVKVGNLVGGRALGHGASHN